MSRKGPLFVTSENRQNGKRSEELHSETGLTPRSKKIKIADNRFGIYNLTFLLVIRVMLITQGVGGLVGKTFATVVKIL